MTNLDLDGFECKDCQENTFIKKEYYMLHDEVWTSVASKFEMLCVGCFENRLGRKLDSDDFVKLPINYGCMFPQSDLLYSRLYSLKQYV